MTTSEKIKWLNFTAKQNGYRETYSKEGSLWICKDFKGKQIWCGTYKEIKRIAKGKTP